MLKIWIHWTHQTPNIKLKLFCCRWTKPRKYKCNINENNTRSRWRHQRRCREDRIVTGHPALLLWWSMMVRMSLKSVCCRVNPEMQVTLIDLFFFFFQVFEKKSSETFFKACSTDTSEVPYSMVSTHKDFSRSNPECDDKDLFSWALTHKFIWGQHRESKGQLVFDSMALW